MSLRTQSHSARERGSKRHDARGKVHRGGSARVRLRTPRRRATLRMRIRAPRSRERARIPLKRGTQSHMQARWIPKAPRFHATQSTKDLRATCATRIEKFPRTLLCRPWRCVSPIRQIASLPGLRRFARRWPRRRSLWVDAGPGAMFGVEMTMPCDAKSPMRFILPQLVSPESPVPRASQAAPETPANRDSTSRAEWPPVTLLARCLTRFRTTPA